MSARTSAKRKTRAQIRAEAKPKNFWNRDAPPVTHVGEEGWRIRVFRGGKALGNNPTEIIWLDKQITQVSWTESSEVMTGSASFVKGKTPLTSMGEGDLFVLDVSRANGAWHEVWRMRAQAPEINVASGEMTVALTSDISFLQRNKDDWKYSKSRDRPKGWRADEIIADVCRQLGFTVERMPPMPVYMKRYVATNKSALEVILEMVKKEKAASGIRYMVRTRRGKLVIEEFKRHRDMLILGPAIIDATVRKSLEGNFATALTKRITGDDPNVKGKRNKIKMTVTSPWGIYRYGYIRRDYSGKVDEGVDTPVELRKFLRSELRALAEPKKEITLTHPGIPTVRRYDAMMVVLPQEGLRELVYVTSAEHTVSPGDYQMSLSLRFTDPFVDQDKEEWTKKRCKAARERGRTLPKECAKLLGTDKAKKKPRRGAARTDRQKPLTGGVKAP